MKRILTAVLLSLSLAVAAHALERTAVSTYGDDANPCKIVAPCATFARAISQTDPGGELIALDSGSFDGFTIDRPMTVSAAPGAVVTVGVEPGVTNWAVKVNAPNERVSIRGLTIITTGPTMGIVAHDAAATYIDDVVIEGNGCAAGCGSGIFGRMGDVFVTNARIRNVAQGVDHNPLDTGRAVITNSVIEYALIAGIHAENQARVTVRDTTVSHSGIGFSAGGIQEKMVALLTMQNCTSSYNTTGVSVGDGGIIRIERSVVHGNTTGLGHSGAGTLITFGNNMVSGNTTDVSGPITTDVLM